MITELVELGEDEQFEAEYKLNNCIRITLNVERYSTEVWTGTRWLRVSEYVEALLKQEYERGRLDAVAHLTERQKQNMIK